MSEHYPNTFPQNNYTLKEPKDDSLLSIDVLIAFPFERYRPWLYKTVLFFMIFSSFFEF
jgi:hypothetical protein